MELSLGQLRQSQVFTNGATFSNITAGSVLLLELLELFRKTMQTSFGMRQIIGWASGRQRQEAPLEIFGTANPQFKISYDSTHNATFRVDSNGSLGINNVGGNTTINAAASGVALTSNTSQAGGDNDYTGFLANAYGFRTAGANTHQTRGIQSIANVVNTNTQNWTNALSLIGNDSEINIPTGTTGTYTGGANYYALTNVGSGTLTNLYGVYIAAPTGAGTITNKYALVTEANAGNVGIGTTNPSSLLNVLGVTTLQSGNATGGLVIGADVNATTLTANVRKLARITMPSYSNTYNVTVLSADSYDDGINDYLEFGGTSGITTPSPTVIIFATTPTRGSAASNAERMRITSTGNVGIGTTSPTSKLSVGSTSQFQVNSTGAIVAATGITSSGTINFSGLTGSKVVFTDSSSNLTSTGIGTSFKLY